MTSTTLSLKQTWQSSNMAPRQRVSSRSHTTSFIIFVLIPALLILLKRIFRYQDLLDLIAAFDYFHHLGVAQVSLDRICAGTPVGAVNLDGVDRRPHCDPRCEVFRDKRLHDLPRITRLFQVAGLIT